MMKGRRANRLAANFPKYNKNILSDFR